MTRSSPAAWQRVRVVRHAVVVALRDDPGRRASGSSRQAVGVVRDEVDDEPEPAQQRRVVADERAALVEVGLRSGRASRQSVAPSVGRSWYWRFDSGRS